MDGTDWVRRCGAVRRHFFGNPRAVFSSLTRPRLSDQLIGSETRREWNDSPSCSTVNTLPPFRETTGNRGLEDRFHVRRTACLGSTEALVPTTIRREQEVQPTP